jgi:hypothetical protein
MQFAQYDTVRIVSIRNTKRLETDAFNIRAPRVGDIACIIEVYSDPPGYDLECSNSDGISEWLLAFPPEEIELELIK